MHYLYRITNQVNQKNYIGQTVNDKTRWTAHKSFAKNAEKTGQYIHRAMAKYGVDNFTYEVIAVCLTQEDANEIESILITQYNCRNKQYGYNVMPGGKNISGPDHPNYGKIHSEETKQKRSQTMKQKCADGWVPKTLFVTDSDATRYWQGKESPRKITLSNDDVKSIIELYLAGQTVKDISERMKIDDRIISRELKDNDIQVSLKNKHNSPSTQFKKGEPSPRKGESGGTSWNKGKLKQISEDQLNKIISMYSDGISFREISKLMHINRGIIRRELKKLG